MQSGESPESDGSNCEYQNCSNDTIDDCDQNPVCQWLDDSKIPVYFGVGVVYVLVAFCSRGFLLLGLYKAMLREPTYFYQMIFGICDLIDVGCFGFYIITNYWLTEWDSYVRCYRCIWITCKFAIAAYDFGITNTLLMSLIMATDRLLSLAVPIKYARFSSKKLKITVACICVWTSVLMNGFDWFMYIPGKINDDDDSYALIVNLEFLDTMTGSGWVTVQNLFLVLGGAALVAVNGFMLKLYRQRIKNLERMTSDNNKASLRKRDEQTLIVVTACQCLFVFLNVLTAIVFYAYTNYSNATCICNYEFMATITDAVCMLVRLSDINICMVVNKRFRELFLDGVNVCNRRNLFVKINSSTNVSVARQINVEPPRLSLQP